MTTIYSSRLRVALQGTGDNPDTWGDVANSGVFQLLEDAIAKLTAIATTGGSTTLTTANGASDQARCLCLDITGVLVSNSTIICPAKEKLYLIRNGTTGAFTVTLKTAAGTGIAVAQGSLVMLYCDGVNVVTVGITGIINADTLDNIDSTGFFILNAVNAITKGYRSVTSVVADAATINLDVDAMNVFRTTLGGNRTITVSNATEGKWIEFQIVQDITGGRTLTWPANFQWASGAAPTLSTTPNAADVVYGRYDGTAAVWRMRADTNFNTGGGGSSNVIVAQNQVDMDLFALAGQPVAATTVTLTINTGVLIAASCTKTAALDLRGFASGTIINIVNKGYILGKGGDGGAGAEWFTARGEPNSAAAGRGARPGQAGGNAIIGPGAGVTTTIDNSLGYIWGGGGGGGGGGVSGDVIDGGLAGGGGGGGGAGGTKGGLGGTPAGSAAQPVGTAGVDGSTGRLGALGAGGAGASSGSASTASGGAGGTWGAAGSAGSGTTTFAVDIAGGGAGAAGKAVEFNGNTVTISAGAGAPHVMGAVS